MPIHPSGINRVNFLSHAAQDSGIAHSINLRGGFQEVYSITERNAIPLMENNIGAEYDGFTQSDDVLSSGKRRVGMFVHVLENRKIYTLIPVGYFGNGGELGETEWAALPEWERAIRINPSESYSSGPAVPIDNTFTVFESPQSGAADIGISADANSCWVEVEFGGGMYNSSIANTAIEMVADVGGLVQGTSVGDLSGIYTYDDLFDAMLFPTSNPVVSPYHSVGLDNSVGSLAIIGSIQNVILDTTANKGLIKLDGVTQGPYAGAVTAATISGPTFSGAVSLTVGPGDTEVENPGANAHEIVLGTAGNKWTSVTTFDVGPDPIDSAGNVYGAIKFQGGDKTTSTQIEGVYPIFLGNASNAFDQRALISHGANNIQCDQTYGETNGSLHHRISIPDEMVNSRTIQVWQYSSVSNSYSEATGAWVTSSETRDIQGNDIDYTLLSKTGSAGGSNLYRIKFV